MLMASSCFRGFIFCALTLFLFLQHALGGARQNAVTSADLDTSVCVTAVSSSGNRYHGDSQIKISGRASDECLKACGLGQNIEGGVSSVTLSNGHFIGELCHPQCYDSCPDIFHFCMKFALAEGTILSGLCADDSLSRTVAPAPESQTP